MVGDNGESTSGEDDDEAATPSKVASRRRSGPSKYVNEQKNKVIMVLGVLSCVLLFAYIFERSGRVQIISDCNAQLDAAADELKLAAQVNSQSGKASVCPPCICPSSVASKSMYNSNGEEAEGGGDDASKNQLTDQEILESDVYRRVTDQWTKYGDSLTSAVKALATELLVAKFGQPPYFVAFDLEFPDSSQPVSPTADASSEGSFLVELAPNEQMPYTNLFFLSQGDLVI